VAGWTYAARIRAGFPVPACCIAHLLLHAPGRASWVQKSVWWCYSAGVCMKSLVAARAVCSPWCSVAVLWFWTVLAHDGAAGLACPSSWCGLLPYLLIPDWRLPYCACSCVRPAERVRVPSAFCGGTVVRSWFCIAWDGLTHLRCVTLWIFS
jgi:hypothetical protein